MFHCIKQYVWFLCLWNDFSSSFSSDNLQPCSGKTSLADDDLSFDTSYASVSFIEYTLNRACLLEADAMAR